MGTAGARPRQKWKILEDVVGLIEKSVVPGADVKVDQRLRAIGKKRKRQCDVVIRYGGPEREFLTIVEVQKRSRKVGIATFQSWCVKRDEVGANCLIAVSEKGFTADAVEAARDQGNRARLLTLTDLQSGFWPVNIVGRKASVMIKTHNPKREGILITVDGPSGSGQFKMAEKVFRRSGRLLSLVDLAEEAFDAIPQLTFLGVGEHVYPLHIEPGSADPMTLLFEGKELPVRRVKMVDQVTIRRTDVPLTLSEYVQVDHHGTEAYALVGTGTVDELPTEIKLIFVPQGNGLLRFATAAFDGPAGKRSVRLVPGSFVPGAEPVPGDRVLTHNVE